MKKNRFAKLLLTGKAATLPLLISQVKAAEITPSFSDMISSELRVIEVPLANSGMHLQSVSADSNSSYGTSSYAAFFCNNELSGTASNTTFVVTGLKPGQHVILAAARNKNDPFHISVDPRLTLGSQGLAILGSAQAGTGAYGGVSGTPMNASFVVPSSTLQQVIGGGKKLYVQALTIPGGGGAVSTWNFSELDEITVGNCVTTAYGVSIY